MLKAQLIQEDFKTNDKRYIYYLIHLLHYFYTNNFIFILTYFLITVKIKDNKNLSWNIFYFYVGKMENNIALNFIRLVQFKKSFMLTIVTSCVDIKN